MYLGKSEYILTNGKKKITCHSSAFMLNKGTENSLMVLISNMSAAVF